MSEEQFEKIIEHQVELILAEKGLKLCDLSKLEIFQQKYRVALMLLCEIGARNEL